MELLDILFPTGVPGPHLLTEMNKHHGMDKLQPWFLWNVSNNPHLSTNDGLAKPLLKLGHEWVISSHYSCWCNYQSCPNLVFSTKKFLSGTKRLYG